MYKPLCASLYWFGFANHEIYNFIFCALLYNIYTDLSLG